MGTWGPGLFQNDIAEDTRDEYIALLKKGKSNREATEEILNEYRGELQESYDYLEMILALAMTQWKYGRLLPEIKSAALHLIQSEWHLDEWKNESLSVCKKRCDILQEFQKKMETPMPPEKKIIVRKQFICPWNTGDVFTLPVTDKSGVSGMWKYILFQKIRSVDNGQGDRIPVLHVSKKLFDAVPTVKDLQQSDLQPFWRTPEEYLRLLPEARAIYGFCYALTVDANSIRQYPKGVTFLGNCPVSEGLYERVDLTHEVDHWSDFVGTVLQWHAYWKDDAPQNLI